jgi:hypothetical protein
LVGNEKGDTVNVIQYDWSNWFAEVGFKNVPGISKFHYFKFNKQKGSDEYVEMKIIDNLDQQLIMELPEHNFKVEYKAGKKHVNADALSRMPERCNLKTTEDLPLYELIDIFGSKLDELKVEQEKDEEKASSFNSFTSGETVEEVEFSKSISHLYQKIYSSLVFKDNIICKFR